MKKTAVVLLCITMLVACAQSGAAFQFYVVIKPGETDRLHNVIASIAKDEGLATASAERKISDEGVLRVVEGRGHRLMLWVQNVVLGGNEDPNLCGVHHGPYPDPAEFIVFTEPRLFGSKPAAIELGERVFAKFQKAGFDVLRNPAICGAAFLRGAS